MSTIASPRSTSIPPAYRNLQTPTTSARPSIDTTRSIRSTSTSPSRMPPRRNRAALREYYNLQSSQIPETETSSVFSASTTDDSSNLYSDSDVAPSPLDAPDFDVASYIATSLSTLSLAELLRAYNSLLGDIRALDAEKKALVYDNYNKLISATETIMKMRTNMEPGNPMVGTLDPAIGKIYERVEDIRREAGVGVDEERARTQRRKKAAEAAKRIVEIPDRLRSLVQAGEEEEASELWKETLSLLKNWKESGRGGSDVQTCIDDGEAALRGEPPIEGSWSSMKLKITT